MGNLFDRSPEVLTADYKSAGSHQDELLTYSDLTTADTYYELYVVPAGKTLFISGVVSALNASGTIRLATGASSSEVDFYKVLHTTSFPTYSPNLLTPIKLSSGTRLSAVSSQNNGAITIVGWIQSEN